MWNITWHACSQVKASVHELKAFLADKDPTNQWGGLKRVVLPEGSCDDTTSCPVVWCCSSCLQSVDVEALAIETATQTDKLVEAPNNLATTHMDKQIEELREKLALSLREVARLTAATSPRGVSGGCFNCFGMASGRVHPHAP